MKRARAVLLFAALAALAVRAAEPPVEFAGVLTAGGKTRIALTDKATGITRWSEPGDEFNGYRISRYDAKEDALFLTKDGQEYRLGLVAAKTPAAPAAIAAAPPAAAPPAEAAAVAAIRGNLRTLAAAARQYQLERGPGPVAYSDLVGPGKLIAELKAVAGENYAALTFGGSDTAHLSVRTADGVAVSLEPPPPPLPGATAPIPPVTPPAATALAAAPAAASPPLTPTGRDPAPASYLVRTGDTWEKIAAGASVSVDELKRLNPGATGGSPPAGQTIRIR